VKSVALILAPTLGFAALTIPAHATTTYEITFTLKENGQAFWTTTMSVEATNNKTTLVPIGFYNAILWFESDTFKTNFTLQFPINNFALEVTSDPQGLTVIFQPMLPGDVNGDKVVDVFDLASVASVFGGRSLFYDLSFEFTFEIDIFDLVVVAINFGHRY